MGRSPAIHALDAQPCRQGRIVLHLEDRVEALTQKHDVFPNR